MTIPIDRSTCVDAILEANPKDISALHWVMVHAYLSKVLGNTCSLSKDVEFRRVKEITFT